MYCMLTQICIVLLIPSASVNVSSIKFKPRLLEFLINIVWYLPTRYKKEIVLECAAVHFSGCEEFMPKAMKRV